MKSLAMILVFVIGLQTHASAAKKHIHSPAGQTGVSQSFYEPFIYTVTGDCRHGNVEFHTTFSWIPAKLGVNANGREILAFIGLQLFSNGVYYAEYQELAMGHPANDMLFSKALTGKWRVNENQLLVEGLGIGTPGKINYGKGKIADAIEFRLTTTLHDSRILETTMKLGRGWGGNGPFGVTVKQYCTAR